MPAAASARGIDRLAWRPPDSEDIGGQLDEGGGAARARRRGMRSQNGRPRREARRKEMSASIFRLDGILICGHGTLVSISWAGGERPPCRREEYYS